MKNIFKNIKDTNNIKNLAKFLIPIAIIIAGLIIAESLYSISQKQIPGELSSKKAAERVIKFINSAVLQGQATASLVSVEEKSGIYKLIIEINNQAFESYVTRDGKLLFGPATEITEESLSSGSQATETSVPKTDIPKVELFVMSFCPYGNQAEELMMPVAKLLKNKADIELHYVIYSNYRGGGADYCLDKENKYCSMHGINELNQDVRELCVQKYYKEKVWDFVKEVNNNCGLNNVETCWEGIAKNLGIDIGKIKTCQKNEALDMLAEEVALNKKYGISGSPQLIVNGVEYQGTRSSNSYKNQICAAFNNPPQECSQDLSSQSSASQGGCQ